MAKSCGLRIGTRRFELVTLEGSAKRPKVISSYSGEFPEDEEDPLGAATGELKRLAKEHNVARENIGVAIDAKHAAYRRLTLPVDDDAKIEKVIKFEVEGHLPQFSIEDVVVDFHKLESSQNSSILLATAVPKEEIERIVEFCTAAGLEPLEVELETTAMVNAAVDAGISVVDSAQVLVHVGEESTGVAVMDGAKVREMRSIQVGALTDSPPEDLVRRIQSELARTISAARTINELQAVFVCGLDLPGLAGGEVLGLPVQPFDTLETEGDGGGASIAVAYGVALRQLGGGVLQSSLRREELKFSGAMERLELPLAVVALLLVTLLGVFNIFISKEEQYVDQALYSWRESSNNFMIGKGGRGNLEYPSDELRRYVKQTCGDLRAGVHNDDPDRNRFEQLTYIRSLLNKEIRTLEKKLGQGSEVTQPQSAFRGMTLVLDVLHAAEQEGARFGRPSLRKMRSTYTPGRSGKPDTVRISMDAAFFAEDSTQATVQFETMVEELRAQGWCESVKSRGTDTLEDGEVGIWVEGLDIVVDLVKAGPERSA
ncbi:MAG: hypothetical protein CMJ84_04735 [Planctomycetes bacterium]|jgi:hypothetical protein|nr:hypothetical protein [Planctomycetota bacterium]MDP6407949.1 pilus assembly protein PilM [Planctomycetota bacterium]